MFEMPERKKLGDMGMDGMDTYKNCACGIGRTEKNEKQGIGDGWYTVSSIGRARKKDKIQGRGDGQDTVFVVLKIQPGQQQELFCILVLNMQKKDK